MRKRQFRCLVQDVGLDSFSALRINMGSGDNALPVLTNVYICEVPLKDRYLLRKGAMFDWSIALNDSGTDAPTGYSRIKLRRPNPGDDPGVSLETAWRHKFMSLAQEAPKKRAYKRKALGVI
jgi:hypothetical protein